MTDQMTKREARKLVGVETDHALALALGVRSQAVYQWGADDDPIPQQRVWQIRAMLADRERTE